MEFLNRGSNGNKKGVYCIRNTANNKIYIGATTRNFRSRYTLHNSLFRRNKHNSKIQDDYNIFGDNYFVFEILFIGTDDNEIMEKEKEFIEMYDSINNGYNCTRGGDGGLIFPDELRNKMSESARKRNIGSKMTEENKVALRNANKRKRTDEEKEHLSIIFSGENSNFAVLTENEVINIKKDFVSGMDIKDVCEKYNINSQHAKEIKYDLRWKRTKVDGWEEFQKSRKKARVLSEEEYNNIVEMILDGYCNNQIAKKHNISYDRIKNIRKKLNT